MQNNIAQQNAAVKSWFSGTLQQIKRRYITLVRSPDRSGDGLDSLKSRTKQTYGEIDQGGFSFQRYLIWVHKGAGKGMGGQKGSNWYDGKGNLKRTDPKSFGKMNTGARKAEEWMNPVLEIELPKLADIVAGFKADAAIKHIQIK